MTDHELNAAVAGDRERRRIEHRVHVDTIRARHAKATGGRWYAVDLRHQRGGQVRIFAGRGNSVVEGGIVANVLRSGPNVTADGEFVGNAHGDVAYLLAELDRVSVDGDAGLRLAAAILHIKEGYRHAPIYSPGTCHVCARAADAVAEARLRFGGFADE